MKLLFIVVALLLLPACSVLYGRAKFNDAALEGAERFICEEARVGSIRQRYGQSEEGANAWKGLCIKDSEFLP